MFRRTVMALVMMLLCGGIIMMSMPGSAFAQSEDNTHADANGVTFEPACGCSRRPPAVVEGSYTGSISDTSNGPGTFNLTLDQHTRQLHGTWSTSFQNGQSANGTVSGNVGSKTVHVKLITSDPKCHYKMIATIESNALQGAMVASKRCTDDNGGNFLINKQ